MIPQREKPKSFDDVKQQFQDIRDRMTLEDLNPGEVRTEAPTTSTLDKGKSTLVELAAGTRWIYYRDTAGSMFRVQLTAV